MRKLSEEEHNEYRRPFLVESQSQGREVRRPLLSFAKAVPIVGDRHSKEVVAMMKDAREWLGSSSDCEIPKLLLAGDPGGSLTEEEKGLLRSFRNFSEVVVTGKHLITEDSPDAVGKAIAQWYGENFK